MTKPFETIYDIISGETTIREFTDLEIKELENARKENAKLLALAETEAETKNASKKALLEKLGITAEEAALLLS
jgi:vacuolar-type H+-ATPase subunit H